MKVDKQITKWAFGSEKMEASFTECPECVTISDQPHSQKCSKPGMIRKHIKTTQFGPCDFGDWLVKLMVKLNAMPGAQTEIKSNMQGQFALFNI